MVYGRADGIPCPTDGFLDGHQVLELKPNGQPRALRCGNPECSETWEIEVPGQQAIREPDDVPEDDKVTPVAVDAE